MTVLPETACRSQGPLADAETGGECFFSVAILTPVYKSLIIDVSVTRKRDHTSLRQACLLTIRKNNEHLLKRTCRMKDI